CQAVQEDCSSLTTASYPFSAAHDSGVRPSLSFEFTLAPLSNSNLTMASCPFPAAHHSGVRSKLSFKFTLAPFSSSSSTTASRPSPAAHDSSVRPKYSSFGLTLAPLSHSSSTTVLYLAAIHSGVWPEIGFDSTSAFLPSSSLTMASCP